MVVANPVIGGTLFGKPVYVRQTCRCNGQEVSLGSPRYYVNFYVRITGCCSCHCSFCNFGSDEGTFDRSKFLRILPILKDSLWVNKIVITGGEPVEDFPNFLLALQDLRGVFPHTHLTVNTNGILLSALGQPETLDLLSCVSVSRHHHVDSLNAEIFGIERSPSEKESIEAFRDKDKLHLRCNLIKGYIDSPTMIRIYMEHMSRCGVRDFGFVDLMKINPYCKNHFVGSLSLDSIPNTIKSQKWSRLDGRCTCRNYLHTTESGYLVKMYDRTNEAPEESDGCLVYDINCLRNGFGGEILF